MQKITRHKHFVALLHLLFWIVIWSVPVLLVVRTPDDDENWPVMIIVMTWLFYMNTEYLYPRFWHKKQFGRYALAAGLAALLASLTYNLVLAMENAEQRFGASIVLKWFMGTAFIAIGTLYKIISGQIRQQRIEREKENEKLRTELSFLRSQVSPHFMFNVLNTLVAKIRQRADDLEDTVIEISNLMRYMLYDSDEEKVSLKTECTYLQSYIDLQMKRFEHSVRVTAHIAHALPDREIEPMLLIPLVENAFKHGTNSIHKPEIDIRLHCENGLLQLSVTNSKSHIPAPPGSKPHAGIGLDNLARRLDLLYPRQHALLLEDGNHQYKAILSINLNP